MSDDRNPERDWPIMRARDAVRNAEKFLEGKPSPFNALELQHKQYELAKLSRLTLVKNDDEEHSGH